MRLVCPQGSWPLLVSSLTWALTSVIACWISTPGVVMWAISARVNGLLVPSWPSSAVCPGPVANAIRVPSPDFISARPDCTETLRVEAFDLILAAKGLSRSEEHTSELQSRQYLVCR